ncbi:MAG: hypothetical protein J2P40_13700 [Candidatus Dormibacteraeota bacterium]|nr:hypothetical protein [Candidatus Dormibacteraeota bacterium]MBO0762325.1 hypothetical protein [Candidatus Dormibacteraeota bacterium]
MPRTPVIGRLESVLGGFFGGGPRMLVMPGRPLPREAARRHARRREPVPGEQWAGRTEHFLVYSDGSAAGAATAEGISATCEADLAHIRAWFGGIVPAELPVEVHVDPDAVGAYHLSCRDTDIHVVADPVRAPGYVAALLVEVLAATEQAGWDCGRANGESLSRALAFSLHPELAVDFRESAESWWQAGHPDRVNDKSATDSDELACGCGVLFLLYLRHQLGVDWSQIIAAGSSDLGETYRSLTGFGGSLGFADFVERLDNLEEDGRLLLPRDGNPFPIER